MKLKLGKGKYHSGDHLMAVFLAMLCMAGLVMVYSASYYVSLSKFGNNYHYLINDAAWMLLGLLCFLFFAFLMDYHYLKFFAWPAIIVGMILLLLIFTPLGLTINRATRWLDFKLFTVMPGEIIKICLIVFVAAYFAADPEKGRHIKGQLPILGIAALVFVLIYKQPNLSTAGLCLILVVGMMFVAGLPTVWIVSICGVMAAGLVVALLLPQGSYMLARVYAAIDPWADPLGSGYQVCQGEMALGSGGVLGLGLSKSIQKTLYLPEPMNDFILAIIGEELGFVGCIVLLGLFLALIWRCAMISINAKDYFGMMLAAGGTILLATQVILNVAVVTAVFFPTGIFLPFISLGGNGTIIFMSIMGIIFNVSRQTPVEEE